MEVKAKSYRLHTAAFHNMVPFSLTVNLLSTGKQTLDATSDVFLCCFGTSRQYFTLRVLLLSEACAHQYGEIFPLDAQGKT